MENLIGRDPSAIGRATPHHGWVWTVLPSDCERAEVHGEPRLAALLRDAGVPDVSSGGPRPQASVDAILLARAPQVSDALGALATRLDPGGVIAVTIGSGARIAAGSRPRRVLAGVAAGLAAERRGRILERRLHASGLRTVRIATGPRWRAHSLAWPPGRRIFPADEVVAASAGERRRTVVEVAIAEAGSALGEPPEVQATSVRGSGALLVELSSPGDPDPKLLRVAAGPAADLLEAALRNLRAIRSAAPPAVTQRLPPLLATGDVGLARYTLEPKLPGRVPRHLDARLWTDCLDFLVALRATARTSAGSPVERLSADARLVGEHVDGAGRTALRHLQDIVRRRLAELAPGWTHGDFWSENLLVADGRLATVLDWDAADPGGLPLLDLLHLIALQDRRLRRLGHGRRVTHELLPLARRGGDARIREYCESTGTPADPATLEALTLAYWLSRVARDLRTFADRTVRTDWMERNVKVPLTAFTAA